MLELSKIISAFTDPGESKKFSPTAVDLTHPFIPGSKETGDTHDTIDLKQGGASFNSINRKNPSSKTVVAIDSTAFMLGLVQDGVVGTVRISVVIREIGRTERRLERYGPYIFMITNQNKNSIYQDLFHRVYGIETSEHSAPESFKMIDRVRNLIERYVQFQVTANWKDSIVLLDGSLIGDTIANPGFYIDKIMNESLRNQNELAAISKFTNLTLGENGRSILSLCEDDAVPSFVGPLNSFIDGNRSRYLGGIYVAKLTRNGESFRIDLPSVLPISSQELFDSISGICGEYGYPEELKLAHSTCVFSSIEILELQAAAIIKYNMQMEENLRKKLFAPF